MSRSSFQIEAVESRLLFARALGIDISDYQTVTNWASVAANRSFVFIKATEGASSTQDNFASYAAGAKNAGLKVGTYHFARPDTSTNDALNEANFFYSVAKNYMGAGYLPPMLDLESGSSLSTPALSTWVNTFNARIKTLCGVAPLIYTNGAYAGETDSSVAQWPLWIANPQHESDYNTFNPSTYQWSTWKFWQYSWIQTVPGISGSGNVDGDVFNGTVADLNAYIASYSTPPAPSITVQQSVNAISNFQSTPIDFGTVTQGGIGTTKTFTISNTGTADLTTSSLLIPAGYTVLDPLKATIGVSSSDSLTIQQTTATAGTFAGNVSFSTNVTGASTFSFPITGKVLSNDTTPPTITGASFVYASATPSLTFTFSENVNASLSTADFVIKNDTTGTTVTPSTYSYDGGTNTATLGFAAALADGNYTASVAGSGVSDAASNVMANSYAFGFFALAGDVNRDRTVDILDLGVLSSHWQSTTALFADGDVNNDGTVDIVDLGILSGNWQKTLPTPAQPDGLRVTASGSSTVVVAKSATVTTVIPTIPVKGKVATTITPISKTVLV